MCAPITKQAASGLFCYFLFVTTASFDLPFCRRLLRIARPDGLADLTRKPWVLARFRLFGLYVTDIVG